jgi:hypothetical protein
MIVRPTPSRLLTRAQFDELLEAGLRRIAQGLHDLKVLGSRHHQGNFAADNSDRSCSFAKQLLHLGGNGLNRGGVGCVAHGPSF